MDKIILGLLLMKAMTIYEIRSFIKQNLQSICSDSMGSIQAAIKKLIEHDMIKYREKVEKSVNKKSYFITEFGVQDFTKWVEKPMQVGKTKNMELSKLFFMGVLPKEKRVALIEEYIEALNKEKEYLEIINSILKADTISLSSNIFKIEDKKYYVNNIKKYDNNITNENFDDIIKFQILTLEYGIEVNNLEISFYERIKKNLTNGAH